MAHNVYGNISFIVIIIYLFMLKKKMPITPAFCSMLGLQHYAQNYAGVLYLTLHHPDLGSDTSSVWNFCSRSFRGGTWCCREIFAGFFFFLYVCLVHSEVSCFISPLGFAKIHIFSFLTEESYTVRLPVNILNTVKEGESMLCRVFQTS